MCRKLVLVFFFWTVVSLQAREYDPSIQRILMMLKRRNSEYNDDQEAPNNNEDYGEVHENVPEDVPEDLPEDLPEAEPIVPGHTLIQPSDDMLGSGTKFPVQDQGKLVYGNLDNLGITYDKVGERLLYTGFRRQSKVLDSAISEAIQNIFRSNGNKRKDKVILLELGSNEKLQPSSQSEEDLRRANKRKKHIGRSGKDGEDGSLAGGGKGGSGTFGKGGEGGKNGKGGKGGGVGKSGEEKNNTDSSTSSSSEESSGESDFEKNPGNPYTLYKEKYKQNYLWNHFMDGDHMNLSPMAPNMNTLGPSGVDLFFGRKWWYFNQDDYKPLG